MNKSARGFAFGVLALAVLASSPRTSLAAGTAKSTAPARAVSPGTPGLTPIPPRKGPGEIRIKILGRSSKEVAGTLQEQFQLYRAGAPLFRTTAWVAGGSANNPLRGLSDEIAYAEGEYFYLKGLEPGVYDLHFARVAGYYPFRPVHIDGILVEAGKIAELEDLRMELGETLVQIGTPALLPEPAVNVVDRLNALVGEILALQKRASALEQANTELRTENGDLKRRLQELEAKQPKT